MPSAAAAAGTSPGVQPQLKFGNYWANEDERAAACSVGFEPSSLRSPPAPLPFIPREVPSGSAGGGRGWDPETKTYDWSFLGAGYAEYLKEEKARYRKWEIQAWKDEQAERQRKFEEEMKENAEWKKEFERRKAQARAKEEREEEEKTPRRKMREHAQLPDQI